MVHHQTLHLHQGILGRSECGLEISFGRDQKLLSQSVEKLLTPLFQHRHDLCLHQGADGLDPEVISRCFGEGSLHQFLDEQTVHLTAAQEALGGVDDPVDQGAVRFRFLLVELEFPVEMPALPARGMQARHHALGEGVDGDLVNPFGQALAPVLPMALQGRLHGLPLDRMATVMAVADAVRTFDRGEAHGKHGGVFLT